MKTAKSDPLHPLRSDYRILKKILDASTFRVQHVPEEYDLMIAVFNQAGGNWEQVFDGNVEHLTLLKKITRIAYKKGYLTKSPKW